MTLHLFNPAHDEALAANYPHYYPSTIARRLAEEWCTLPALWAEAGDAVLVTEEAKRSFQEETPARLVVRKDLTPAFWQNVDEIAPWGWDLLVRHQLRKARAPERLLPSDERLATWRDLSSRRTTAELLPRLRHSLYNIGVETVGESHIAATASDAQTFIEAHGGAVVKSLWSCSGRGVFKVAARPTANDTGRIARLLREHGGVELEPIYPTLLDFALEFEAQRDGGVQFLGFSVFSTNSSGSYMGNVVASQAEIKERIACGGLSDEGHGIFSDGQVFSSEVLDRLPSLLCPPLADFLAAHYAGPFGIDMMLVRPNDAQPPLLHPLIELNLRRTMGHVALVRAKKG